MGTAMGTLLELRMEAGGFSAKLDCPQGLHPSPGQYLLASSPDSADVLPTPLFAVSLPGEILAVVTPVPTAWMVGAKLHLRGPLGSGFHLPTVARRAAFAAFQAPSSLLQAGMRQALKQAASVVLCTAFAPPGLPPEVEVLPLDLLPDTLTWADYLAACFPLAALAEFRRCAGVQPGRVSPFSIPSEALVLTSMPCAGVAECGVCTVPTRRGRRLACSDGPVFELNLLEEP